MKKLIYNIKLLIEKRCFEKPKYLFEAVSLSLIFNINHSKPNTWSPITITHCF